MTPVIPTITRGPWWYTEPLSINVNSDSVSNSPLGVSLSPGYNRMRINVNSDSVSNSPLGVSLSPKRLRVSLGKGSGNQYSTHLLCGVTDFFLWDTRSSLQSTNSGSQDGFSFEIWAKSRDFFWDGSLQLLGLPFCLLWIVAVKQHIHWLPVCFVCGGVMFYQQSLEPPEGQVPFGYYSNPMGPLFLAVKHCHLDSVIPGLVILMDADETSSVSTSPNDCFTTLTWADTEPLMDGGTPLPVHSWLLCWMLESPGPPWSMILPWVFWSHIMLLPPGPHSRVFFSFLYSLAGNKSICTLLSVSRLILGF